MTFSPPKLEMSDTSYGKAVSEYLDKLNSSTPEF